MHSKLEVTNIYMYCLKQKIFYHKLGVRILLCALLNSELCLYINASFFLLLQHMSSRLLKVCLK